MAVKVTTNAKSLMSELNQFVVEESNDLLNELAVGIKRDTPVDTGRAQAGWEITAPISKVGDTGVLNNNVDYVIYLEEGHSGQAPAGFIQINIIKALNERE
jgi:hypothetical protein